MQRKATQFVFTRKHFAYFCAVWHGPLNMLLITFVPVEMLTVNRRQPIRRLPPQIQQSQRQATQNRSLYHKFR